MKPSPRILSIYLNPNANSTTESNKSNEVLKYLNKVDKE